MRKTLITSIGLMALVSISTSIKAEETVIRSESSPSVTVERREGVVESRNVTTSSDCGSKTVHKEDSAGNSATVHKEGC